MKQAVSQRTADTLGRSTLKVPKLKDEQRVLPTFSKEDIAKFATWRPKTFASVRLQAVILMLADTGTRIDEVVILSVPGRRFGARHLLAALRLQTDINDRTNRSGRDPDCPSKKGPLVRAGLRFGPTVTTIRGHT
jgi:hypothetical protein